MAARVTFRQRVEEELQTLFVCPDALQQQQQQCLTGQGDQLLSKLVAVDTSKAEQHFERSLQQQEPGAFGPDPPANNQKAALKSLLNALAFSNSKRTPGFGCLPALLQQQDPLQQGDQQRAFDSALLRLLRRVSLWWYYRVMFDPLEQLVALSSSYELLFQLMTPHQQLSCMADILLVLACPALQEQSAQLDTPLHTATLLSMLKMAQQLAAAEAELQEQQQQLASTMEQLQDKREKQQPQPQLVQQRKTQLQAACQAAAVLTSPGSTLLQLARQHGQFACSSQQQYVKIQQEIQRAGVLPARALPGWLFQQHLPCLVTLSQQRHNSKPMEVIGTQHAEVSLQQSNAARAVGTLLAHVSQLTPLHRQLWWHAYETAEQADSLEEAILHLLRRCCSAVSSCELPQLVPDGDPVSSVLAWVLNAVGFGAAGQPQHTTAAAAEACAPRDGSQQQQRQDQQQQGVRETAGQQEGGQQQEVQQDGRQQKHWQQDGQQDGQQQQCSEAVSQQEQQRVQEGPHPAEALRQLLDVLMCALQGRFAEWMKEWTVGPCQEGRTQLLEALHCHCMQLLSQARDQLPAEVCLLGQPGSPGCSSGCSSPKSDPEQQQQREAWQLCLSQVQHDLLLVLQLTQQWRVQDTHPLLISRLLLGYMKQPAFVVEMMNPLSDPALATAAERAARKVLDSGWARIEQQLPEGQREQLAAVRLLKMQEESRLQALQRATAEWYGFEAQHQANQAGMSSRSGSVAATATSAAAALAVAAGSSSSSGGTAAAGSGSLSHGSSSSRRTAAAGASSSQQVSAAGQRQAPGPVDGAKQWQKVMLSLAQINEMFQRMQSGDLDPRLPALCKALRVGSVEELSLYVALSTGIVSCRMGGRSDPLLGTLASFLARADWDASLGRTLAHHVQALLAVLGHKAAGLVCGHDLIEHANTVLQLREQRQLHSVDRAAAAAGGAAGVSSCDAFGDPVLRLRGGGPGSSAASSEEGECPSDGEDCRPISDAASAQEAEHSSPTAVEAAAATGASTSHQASSSSSSGSAPATALPDSILQAYASALGILQRLALRTGKPDWSKLQQEVGLAGPAAEAAAQHLVDEFSPASRPAHFNSMPMQAAMQWVALLLKVPHTADFVRAMDGIEQQLSALGLPGLSARVAAMETGDVDDLGCRCHAAFTVLLTQDERARGAATWPNGGAWTAAKKGLLEALEVAFRVAKGLCETFPMRLHNTRLVIKANVCNLFRELHTVLDGESEVTCQLGEGLAGLKEIVGEAAQLMLVQLERLGPQEVKPYNSKDLNDPMLKNGASELGLDEWRHQFAICLSAVRVLVLVESTYLARAGRHMQRFGKMLRKVYKALSAADADPYLTGLCRHHVAPLCVEVGQHLRELQSSHRLLRNALQDAIVPAFWGVLQRAFNVHLELRCMKHNRQARGGDMNDNIQRWMDVHDGVLCEVLGDMVQYLPKASTRMPLLPPGWEPQPDLLLQQPMWEELLSLYSSMQPPIASLYFLLYHTPATSSVAARASGQSITLESLTQPTTAAAGVVKSSTSSHSRGSSKSLTSVEYDSATDPAVLLSTWHEVETANLVARTGLQTKADRQSIRTELAAFGGAPTAGSEEHGRWDSLCQLEEEAVVLLSRQRERRRVRQQRCRQLMQQDPASDGWRSDCRHSLRAVEPPLDCSSASASTCSSSDDSDTESLAFRQLRLRRPKAGQHGSSSSSSNAQQQEDRSIRRQLREALGYRWGGNRPWHVQRIRTLVVRQRQLNQVTRLQEEPTAALARLQDMQQQGPGGFSAQGSSPRQSHQHGRPNPSQDAYDALVRAAAAALASCDDGSSSTPAAAVPSSLVEGPGAALLLHLRQCAWPYQPCGLQQQGKDDRWSSRVAFVTAHRVPGVISTPLQQIKLQSVALTRSQQGLQDLSGPDGVLFKELLPRLAAAQQHGQVEGGCGALLPSVTTRQMLWEVLIWFKGSASPWYEAAAAAYQREHQTASTAASSGADSSKAPVPECTSPALWCTLTRSLASDLLLVPPSIRDLVGNGWAAGAGRLGASGHGSSGGGSSSSSSSGVAGVAARMLVVQYARAARRQYVQDYQPLQLLGQLLNVQLLAGEGDMLAELQPESAQHVLHSLAACTAAATAGMVPVLAATAAACELAGKPISKWAAQQSSSSGSSGGGKGGSSGDGSNSGSSVAGSSSCSRTERRGPHMPSLFQLATQMGVFAGPAELTLPWLQLLARYHACLANIEEQHAHIGFKEQQQRSPWKAARKVVFDGSPVEFRILAMAKALQSFGAPLPAVSAQLQHAAGKYYAACAQPPVLASPVGPAPVGQQGGMRRAPGAGLTAAAALPRQGGKCAQQQQAQQLCKQDAEVWAQYLHAERLMQLQPAGWQQQLQHSCSFMAAAAGQPPVGSSTREQDGQPAGRSQQLQQQLCMVADLACDWCCQSVMQPGRPQPSSSVDGGQSGVGDRGGDSTLFLGCPCCGAAQYCSQQCADAAKIVHNANCWRLQGLAGDGLCWKKSSYQRLGGSRSFWDLSCVEQ